MRFSLLLVGIGLGNAVLAATTNSSSTSISFATDASVPASLTELPTGARATYPSGFTYTFSTTSAFNATTTGVSSTTNSNHTTRTSSPSTTQTFLVGTGSRTSASSTASGSVRCNGYTEFCDRKYSNITYVVAHNSPFHIVGNAASNQDLDVTTQLNDGVRGLQSETHYVNDTVFLCHTSCNELNAGTLESYLTTVVNWLEQPQNRFEVVTILLGNEDYINPQNYTAPVTNSGLLQYVYTPPTEPMDISGWPTLGEMILTNKRVVMMLEYDANQQQVPWLLDMWSYQWQTPFSPTDVSFPCTVQRPPGQSRATSQNRLYLANHNLNVAIDLASLGSGQILIPDFVDLDSVNANTTSRGAASLMVNTCTSEWGRPPNFLLVDFYNYGNFNGSSLAAAAQANNVTYNTNSCCGKTNVVSGVAQRVSCSWTFATLGLMAMWICGIAF